MQSDAIEHTIITDTRGALRLLRPALARSLRHRRHRVHAREHLLGAALPDPGGGAGRGRDHRSACRRASISHPSIALMADERVPKVFHAARQDIEIFVKQAGAVPHPIFDTQIAAMVCGYGDQVSYDQLVYRITGDQIDKSSRFTDWSHRPLSRKQIAYAISDVTHLRDIYLSLSAQLAEQDRTTWLDEEMAVL